MQLTEITARYDERLDIAAYADVDPSANGLQVGPDEADVAHVAFAVDAAVETIDRAAAAGADLLVAHHGLVWGGVERVTGPTYDRVAPLIDAGLALYAAHLPLDGHGRLGNAAGLADLLALREREPFATVGGQPIGQVGRAPDGYDVAELAALLDRELDTGGRDVRVLDFGPESLERVAIVTGSGADFLDDAVAAGADVLLTGEGKQQVYHEAREAGVTVVLAGHYATETFGVRSLQALADEWGLETTFLDCPTGL